MYSERVYEYSFKKSRTPFCLLQTNGSSAGVPFTFRMYMLRGTPVIDNSKKLLALENKPGPGNRFLAFSTLCWQPFIETEHQRQSRLPCCASICTEFFVLWVGTNGFRRHQYGVRVVTRPFPSDRFWSKAKGHYRIAVVQHDAERG